MKKFYIVSLILTVIVIGGCEIKPRSFNETKEEKQARYKRLLSCKPDKPLSKGELYEKAMLQYWQEITKSAFNADANAYEYELEKPTECRNLKGNEYKQICGLTYHKNGTPDKVTNDICYPYQVYQFDDLTDFYFGEHLRNKNLADFIVNNKAKVYRWDKQPPIYKAENYNKDVDFMIRHSGHVFSIYPTDCCKLLSYEEVLNQEKESIFYYNGWSESMISRESLVNNNFLVIKTLHDIMKQPYAIIDKPSYRKSYELYPITQCGDILN